MQVRSVIAIITIIIPFLLLFCSVSTCAPAYKTTRGSGTIKKKPSYSPRRRPVIHGQNYDYFISYYYDNDRLSLASWSPVRDWYTLDSRKFDFVGFVCLVLVLIHLNACMYHVSLDNGIH
jgi:hypothetical protein